VSSAAGLVSKDGIGAPSTRTARPRPGAVSHGPRGRATTSTWRAPEPGADPELIRSRLETRCLQARVSRETQRGAGVPGCRGAGPSGV